jgi:2-keto-4-pentenoate hydratase/2-oxohepta-3-ene-1,7-dioic acid hydratase in catechol pathway
MKLCRYADNRMGVVLGEEVADVTHVLAELPAARYPLPRYDPLVANLAILRPKFEAALATADRVPLAGLRLLSPVANPGKLVAAPVNYVKHLEEVLGDANLHHNNRINEIRRAGLFLKATSSLVGAGEGVPIIQPDRRTDHEVELAVVIGRSAKNVSADDALAFVAGYTIGLDITIRGPEERSMRKSPDGYAVLGPWLVTADELPDPGSLTLELSVNGETRQRSNTRDLIIGVAGLIEFATRFYTLHPGDVLYTGTPEGVGPVKAGDTMVARIGSIGEMRVTAR